MGWMDREVGVDRWGGWMDGEVVGWSNGEIGWMLAEGSDKSFN